MERRWAGAKETRKGSGRLSEEKQVRQNAPEDDGDGDDGWERLSEGKVGRVLGTAGRVVISK